MRRYVALALIFFVLCIIISGLLIWLFEYPLLNLKDFGVSMGADPELAEYGRLQFIGVLPVSCLIASLIFYLKSTTED